MCHLLLPADLAGSGYLTCLLLDDDWLLFGEVSDPSLVSVQVRAERAPRGEG